MSNAHAFGSGSPQRALIERLLSDGSVMRSVSLLAAGVQPQAIADALRAGAIVRAAPGAYHLAATDVRPELLSIATACARSPRGIVCLASAAFLNNLVTKPPVVTWLALPVGGHVPKQGDAREQVIHWSYPGAFEVGVVQDEICGVAMRRTDPARTVVDLIRYARYLGGGDLGSAAYARLIRQGGDPATVLEMAEALATPIGAMRMLRSLSEPG